MADTYLDKCETISDKTHEVIRNLTDLIKFQGLKEQEVCKQAGVCGGYLGQCRKTNKIEFGTLLKICDILGVTISKLMSFNYENLVRVKQLDEHKKRASDLRKELQRIEMQIKEEEKAVKVFQNS